MNGTASTVIGLIRDVVVAAIALIILFGVDVSNEQTAGILLLITTVGALGSFLWAWHKGSTKT